MRVLLLSLKELLGRLVLGEATANSSGLLDAEVKRLASSLLERGAQLVLLGLVDDSQDASNRLANFGAKAQSATLHLSSKNEAESVHLGKLGGIGASNLGNTEGRELLLEVLELLSELSLLLVPKLGSADLG